VCVGGGGECASPCLSACVCARTPAVCSDYLELTVAVEVVHLQERGCRVNECKCKCKCILSI